VTRSPHTETTTHGQDAVAHARAGSKCCPSLVHMTEDVKASHARKIEAVPARAALNRNGLRRHLGLTSLGVTSQTTFQGSLTLSISTLKIGASSKKRSHIP
jgi:hypothetical protein